MYPPPPVTSTRLNRFGVPAMLLNLVTPLHQKTERDYLKRMTDDKVHCMGVAKEYGKDYWDGDRRYGYGGYRYIPGYWKPVAEALIRRYGLDRITELRTDVDGNSRFSIRAPRILDVGCGKGFLLAELCGLLPGADLVGFDTSKTGLDCAPPGINVGTHNARDPFPCGDDYFDLVISINALHNLKNYEREAAFGEIQRVGRNAFVCVESYRNDREQFNLQCWALTCAAFMAPTEWIWEMRQFGYTGDYEFIYFE